METTGIAAASTAVASRPNRGLSSLKSEDFFKLLVNEMQHQDPFEPAKTGDMISQVSQLRNIEMSSQFTQAMQTLSASQRAIGTSELLGKFVLAQVDSGAGDGSQMTVGGIVTGIRFQEDGTAMLELDTGDAIRATAVQRVLTAEEAERQIAAGGLAAPVGPNGMSSVAAAQASNAGSKLVAGDPKTDATAAQRSRIGAPTPPGVANTGQPLNAFGRPSWLNLALNL